MKVSIGLSGAGAFAEFALDAFQENAGVYFKGVYDVNDTKALSFTNKYQGKIYPTYADMLKDEQIHLIYIATPPNLHFEQSKQAILAGKHVICEKPAALDPAQAEEVYQLAEERGLLYVVNLMQRYNPLYYKIKKIINEGILGEFLHAYFENYAADENLGPDHWMWNESISGGIFIEHAVHFYDMFAGWLGEGKLLSSHKLGRPGYSRNYYTRVQSVVQYGNALVNMYHGFDQPGRMDRQELRLLFEKGQISLYEWIPVRTTLFAIVQEQEQKQLEVIFPESEIQLLEEYRNEDKICYGNFKKHSVDRKIQMNFGRNENKTSIYRLTLKEFLADQIKWLDDKNHKRLITGENGIQSLKIASEAEQKAQIPDQ